MNVCSKSFSCKNLIHLKRKHLYENFVKEKSGKNDFPTSARCRVRNQVGQTNRWRLPESLYSDLLGSTQAIKAINTSLNHSIMSIISAESPKLMNTNTDINQVYSYRMSEDRPYRPVCANYSSISVLPIKSSTRFSPASNNVMERSHTMPVFGMEKPKTPANATPRDLFMYHSKKSLGATRPDIVLKCLKTEWELHRPFIRKSETLTQLLQAANQDKTQVYHKNSSTEGLDEFLSDSVYHKNNKVKVEGNGTGTEHPTDLGIQNKKRGNTVLIITLNITDINVTRRAMAIALGSLYSDDIVIPEEEAGSILAAACVLGFKQLMDRCKEMILSHINNRTVCKYHQAASKYDQDILTDACERWLELNLIPHVASQIQLRDVPLELLQKILRSNRLFVYNEYSVYKTLAYWVFFQLNPDLHLMPSHSSILSFFNSLSKSSSLIEKEEGQSYAPLFSALRLHGITDTCNVQDMQMTNIIPQKWLVDLLSQHYNSLQAGGDMPSFKNFNQSAIRYGFIIDTEPHYHSEIISLHGFHFELKAVRQGNCKTYVVSLQRLKPGDPVLSFRQCERQTFSMRPDRMVRYNITVNHYDNTHQLHQQTTGVMSHKFGLGEKTSRSGSLKVENAEQPIFVSLSLLFPQS
ncbi:hypothetical protein LOTGIDRAFT_231748 [Lottia gigantea]|uniref:BTB/POZ domain-containing protein 16 n=1 Tax=Lottia gigantea TaxID=225164 RepID=V4AQA9_LOTGI|nr:hypothetical protein LOTGIDRAFT_231748 [Lottia gigantea]ESO96995.1 hypothetical protein LOTGIDRAFT_231748 [Lottia gigantea]